jgi:hypothetical protein
MKTKKYCSLLQYFSIPIVTCSLKALDICGPKIKDSVATDINIIECPIHEKRRIISPRMRSKAHGKSIHEDINPELASLPPQELKIQRISKDI